MTDVLIVVATLVLLAAVFLPTMSRRKLTRQSRCASNIQQIGLAFRIWGTDGLDYPWMTSNNDGTRHFMESTNVFIRFRAASNELSTPKILVCPSDSGKKPAKDFNKFDNQNISYFLGLEADEGKPQTILSGDRNLSTNGVALGSGVFTLTTNNALGWTAAIHKKSGNILLSDGSVQQVSPAALQKQWQAASDQGAIGRLAIP